MAKRRKALIPGLSWSWKRAIGISGLKSKVSQKVGIPLTRGGRERKLGAFIFKSVGCLVPFTVMGSGVLGLFYAI